MLNTTGLAQKTHKRKDKHCTMHEPFLNTLSVFNTVTSDLEP